MCVSNVKQRYKHPVLQRFYEHMLNMAHDTTSELYYNGEPKRGAGHTSAFWDGYSGKFTFTGPKRSAHVIPGTPSAASFMAGREFAKLQRALKKRGK